MNAQAEESAPARWRTTSLEAGERFALAAMPLMAVAVFFVASILDPDSRGHGTHEQLGMMPCASAEYLGVPCPFCGMTTSFTHAAHGDIAGSFWTQPGGLFLFAVMFLVAAVCLGAAISGKWFPALSTDAMMRRYFWIAGVVLGAAWVYKIVTFES